MCSTQLEFEVNIFGDLYDQKPSCIRQDTALYTERPLLTYF